MASHRELYLIYTMDSLCVSNTILPKLGAYTLCAQSLKLRLRPLRGIFHISCILHVRLWCGLVYPSMTI
jgi:hypothetical protein